MGNICRSPAAEGTFRHLVKKKGLDHLFEIDSAGTHAYHVGEPPNSNATKAAAGRGISLQHSARQFRFVDYLEFDYILPMDHDNQDGVLQLARNTEDRSKVFLFRQFDPDARSGPVPGVPDPYYGGMDGFEVVQDIMDRTAAGLLKWILEKEGIR